MAAILQALLPSLLLMTVVIGGIRRYARRRTPRAEGKLDGVLALVAYFCLLGGTVLGVVAIVRGIDEDRIARRWEQVDAEIVRCAPYSRQTMKRSTTFGAKCVLRAADAGPRAELPFNACCTGSERDAQKWLVRHPAGSTLPIYVEPEPGTGYRLAYRDDILSTSDALANARQSLVFALVAAGAWFASRHLTAVRNREIARTR